MSQPDYTCEYPGLVQTDETCFRFTNKDNENSSNERLLFSNYWREQINLYGTKVKYFVNRFNTLSGDNFTNTFVDRKSAGDFLSTFGAQADRFRKEMKRCVELDSYMYIVIEKSIKSIENEAFYLKGKKISTKLKWVFSNLISIQHEFAGHCQFVFTNSRKHSEKIIPKLLYLGKKLWNVDVQYFLDKEEI